jgi:putative oxidoreductase
MLEYKFQITELIIRLFAGILFFFQGYDKIFKIKMPNVINTFMGDAQEHNVPAPLVTSMAYFTSFTELIAGLFLTLGLFTDISLYFLGLDLILVCFAFSLINPIWDMKHVFPRFLLVILLLLLPESNNVFSLDSILNITK